MARGITPGLCSLPIIVNVFPEDVCPYANIVPECEDKSKKVKVRLHIQYSTVVSAPKVSGQATDQGVSHFKELFQKIWSL